MQYALPKPPNGSDIEVRQESSGCVIALPINGWNLQSGGTLGMGILMIFFGCASLVIWPDKTWRDPKGLGIWLYLGIPLFFSAICILWAISFKHRSGSVVISSGRLLLIEHGKWLKKKREFELHDLRTVVVGNHFLTTKDARFLLLEIVQQNGRKTKFFAGRSERELEWLANGLNLLVTSPESPHS